MRVRDLGLWIIIGAFVVWELVCYFTHNQQSHTLSWNIWHLEAAHPWVRVIVGLAVVLLFVHLVFRWPHRRKKGAA